ncbi:pyrimidine dimer DNA glycosylase/endonuclease V [Nesterenkonia ebinurensis]|uniref:pyrimidine dimer DNA glycosylase/endonuclease V n=1 Tax=Nesterenkonia ebinurensis TaxID=2608252 RepID=UPI00123CFF38|nr:pyrimidine dimer DNA glycosylase/endonuclease V [Nesterenkonia ebinurensis]
MRLWSLHPSVLDRQGLVACWREALLAQAVLLGRTRGYTRHPQLERFQAHPEPAAAIASYLSTLHQESLSRGYRFDAGRIADAVPREESGLMQIEVTTGQLEFEWKHLQAKLAERSPQLHAGASAPEQPVPVHPLFRPVPGAVEAWERP